MMIISAYVSLPKKKDWRHMLYSLSKSTYISTSVLCSNKRGEGSCRFFSQNRHMWVPLFLWPKTEIGQQNGVRLLSHDNIKSVLLLLCSKPSVDKSMFYLLSKSTYMSSSVSLVQIAAGDLYVCVFCPRIYVKTVLLLLCSK